MGARTARREYNYYVHNDIVNAMKELGALSNVKINSSSSENEGDFIYFIDDETLAADLKRLRDYWTAHYPAPEDWYISIPAIPFSHYTAVNQISRLIWLMWRTYEGHSGRELFCGEAFSGEEYVVGI